MQACPAARLAERDPVRKCDDHPDASSGARHEDAREQSNQSVFQLLQLLDIREVFVATCGLFVSDQSGLADVWDLFAF